MPHKKSRSSVFGSLTRMRSIGGDRLKRISQFIPQRPRSRGDTTESFLSQVKRRGRSRSRSRTTSMNPSDCYVVQTNTGSPVRLSLTPTHLIINGYQILYEHIIYWGHTSQFFKVSYVENLYCADQRRRDLCLYPISNRGLSEYRKGQQNSKTYAKKKYPSELAEMMQKRISQIMEQHVEFKEASNLELRSVLRQVDTAANIEEEPKSFSSASSFARSTRGRLSSIRELEALFKSQNYVPRNGSVAVLAGDDDLASVDSTMSETVNKRHSTGEVLWKAHGQGSWEDRHKRFTLAA